VREHHEAPSSDGQPTIAFEDLIGAPADAGAEYFDRSEYTFRASFEDTHYWHVHRRRVIAEELRSFAPPSNARLLELGCGIGTVATHLNGLGFHVDYSDVYGEALQLAAARARARLGSVVDERRFLRMDVTDKVQARGYSGMMLFDVVEHLPDDEKVMRNVREALAAVPDAFVMVTVPAFQSLWSPWDNVERHKRRYTRDQLVALLERTGFSVARSTYFFVPLFFAAWAMKGLRTVRRAVGEVATPTKITQLTEARNDERLNKVLLSVLGPERRWLERSSLPLGTSILALARCR
jgi:2-polyprenyl-3-methyl-5-hydroxy-6-metoxy-1,4-benzoquinol methylase